MKKKKHTADNEKLELRPWSSLRDKILRDPKVKKMYDELEFEYALISEIIDADGNYTRVQRHKLKGIFKSALKSQTRYSAAMFYTKVTPFLARKYASIWCVIGCDKKDRYDKWKNDKKLGAKMWLAERVLGPRAELYTYLTKCLYAPDQCTPDKVIEASEKGTYRTAVEGCEDGCGRDNGAHKSPVLNNMEIAMLAKATSFGSDHNKLSQLFNSFEREGFISRLFTLYDKNAAIQDKADQISEAKFDEEGVDEDTQRRARDKDVDRSNVSIFRTLGYIYWAALIFKTIDELPQMVAKMNYDINSMNMAQVWDMYRTVPDEGHKEGETDAELYGSFVTSLGPGLQPVDGESGDKQVGGTAGAECSPLYHALISNGPNEPAGSGVSRISDCKEYICADGNPLAAEELVCDEEKLHGRSDFVAALDSVKVLPGWKYLANASSFIVNTVNALFSELVSIITSVLPFLNDLLNFLANAAMKLADWAQLDEVFKHLAKWILGVNVNLISNNMSGARTFNLMAGGADVSGNAFSHNGIGGVALKPGQIQANLEYYQEKQLAEYRQKSFFAQMTDTESPYSPAGRLALTLPSNSVAVANSINNTWTDFIKNPFAKLTNIATSIFSPRASASGFVPGKDPFGATQYGYPLDDPFFKENPDEYWKKYCVSNLPNGDRNPSYLTDEWNLFAAENVNNSETYQPENIQTTEFQRIVPSNKYGTNGCLLIQTAVASAGIIFTDEVLSDEELAELNPPTGGGGSIDCSSYVNTTWGQINTNGSMMPDTPPDEFRQIIVDQAPGRSCPDWKLSEHLPANVLSRLVPNNEHEYYANCSRSSAQPDTCYVNTGSDGRRYIEVKYRDPPVSGSDTHKVYLDGGGNNPPTEPPCRGDVCYD